MFGAFIAGFMEYFITFLVFVVCATAAAFVGIALRKKKNAKEAVSNGEIPESEA
mgnify:CR=1 FL=1